MKPVKLVISFSGVDGAGKTTISRIIKEKLSAKGLKVVEFRSRPSLLPILSVFKYGKKQAHINSTEALPRMGGNVSQLSSWLRYFYYLTDYLFGQIYIYFRYTKRNYVVIYDRFYFDYILDPKRFNLLNNMRLTMFFFRFVMSPNINIFLHAPAEIILERKRELDATVISSLTEKYITFFENLEGHSNSKYICIENIDVSRTVSKIDNVLQFYFKGGI